MEQIKNDFSSIGYRVSDHLLMAANYGVPQTRERVFIVGVRNDCLTDFSPPLPTHAFEESKEDHRKPWVPRKTRLTIYGAQKRNPIVCQIKINSHKRETMESIYKGIRRSAPITQAQPLERNIMAISSFIIRKQED